MNIGDAALTNAGIIARVSDDNTTAYLTLPEGGEVIVATDGTALHFMPLRSGGQRRVYELLGWPIPDQ